MDESPEFRFPSALQKGLRLDGLSQGRTGRGERAGGVAERDKWVT